MPIRSAIAARRVALALSAALVWSVLAPAAPVVPGNLAIGAESGKVPAGFVDQVALSGLVNPTVVRFAADGRVFVAEKRGVIKVFDSLSDPSPSVYADFQNKVHNFWDRGLLGMALDPDFPSTPDVYVLYARDALPGGAPPAWNDACPSPPGATTDGCVVTGQLSRFHGSATGGPEQPLLTAWCQQFPSHSVGALRFGPDGMLYVSAGDGASFTFTDYGQRGSPNENPCGDPPGGVGGNQSPPTAEGGALRSQDLRTPGDPAGLNGALLRLNPDTGQAAAGNPGAGSSDANVRRIVAYGMRNPFRFTFRPGIGDLWVGDVGYSDWEEINRITSITGSVKNLGWPCYEGNGRQGAYDGANLNICEDLYDDGPSAVRAPYFTYRHSDKVVAGESCATEFGSSISGLAFYDGGSYPNEYADALFFSDYSRDCIWAMPAGGDGLPDASERLTFVAGAANPVDIEIGPGGDLFYVDFDGGTIHRVRYTNHAPTAVATATPDSGPLPLQVRLSGAASTDPDGDTLSYAWDLDEDGQFDDANGATINRTFSTAGAFHPAVRVSDGSGGTDTDSVTVFAGNDPPTATILAPSSGSGSTWWVGKRVFFSGSASDHEQGSLPRSAFSWELLMHHCPASCHTHVVQTWAGVKGGSFVAPDHEYPSFLELRLTVEDAGGRTGVDSVEIHPRTVDVTVRSSPAGMWLSVGNRTARAGFTERLIEGGSTTVSAPGPQSKGGVTYRFAGWSDGLAATHLITASVDRWLTAWYAGPPTVRVTRPNAATQTSNGTLTVAWSVGLGSHDAIAYSRLVEQTAVPDGGSCSGVRWANGRAWWGKLSREVSGLQAHTCYRFWVTVGTRAGHSVKAHSTPIRVGRVTHR